MNFSFWIAPSASIPGRTALLITSYLILTNMSVSAVDFDSPGFTAMDVWFYVCRHIVGLAFFEFFFVLRISSGRRGMMGMVRPTAIESQTRDLRTAAELSVTYDGYAFFIFNAVFIIFCVVYVYVCLFFG